jgi:hypothetical protein
MIKAKTGRAYDLIDEAIRQNGGKPPLIEGMNIPMTRENWDKIQKEIKSKIEKYAKERRLDFLFENSSKIYNC